MANLRTQIHFRAADEKGAKILSDKLGARKIREYSGGISSGKRSSNWQVTMKPWFKPAELKALGAGRATLNHPRSIGHLRLLRRLFTNCTARNTYYEVTHAKRFSTYLSLRLSRNPSPIYAASFPRRVLQIPTPRGVISSSFTVVPLSSPNSTPLLAP